MPSIDTWQHWLARLYNLKRDKRGTYERPHKAVLLLTILDLFDRGIICHNQVPFSPELIKTFERYFDIVRREDDQPSLDHPYYDLAADGFWQVLAKSGNRPVYDAAQASRPPSTRVLRETYGRFDDNLWTEIVTYAKSRRQLREALISRYFPAQREELDALTGKQVAPPAAVREEAPGREAAFRDVILDIYDHRCAACGIRLKVDADLSLVEAAHIIPFEVNQNDRPDNGLALCPNHLWAFDFDLIAPCADPGHPAGVWRVHPDLDARIDGRKDLVALANQPVIAPNEDKFLPTPEGLRWREERLKRKW